MKVLLTQPIIEFIKEPPKIPDLGLGYIATVLKKSGHTVYVRDWNMNPTAESFSRQLSETVPDVVGLKVFTKDVFAAKKTIALIRDRLHECTVIIGGPHPSAVNPVELMEDFTECDFAIKGEAEYSLPVLLNEISFKEVYTQSAISSKQKMSEIPGLVWRDGKQVYSNPLVFVTDLNLIDFPCWEMIDPNMYETTMFGSTLKEGSTAPIITTRGCPGKCSFCSAFNVNGKKIRHRSPENVLEEILLLYNGYNVRKLMFQDNCFTSIKDSLTGICSLIIKEKLQIEWDCVSYERLSNLTEETLSLMYKAGCRMIHMGVESGSEKTRRSMNKACSLEEITVKSRLIKESGIKVGAWFMLGFPGETEKEMQESIRYALSLGAELVTFTICFPLPGSAVYDFIKEKYGFDKIDWSDFDIYESKYPVSALSSHAITSLLKKVRIRLRLNNQVKKLISIFRVI